MCRDWSSVRVLDVVWLAVFLLHTRAVESQVIVTFTSSPDPPTIVEGDTAVLNCSSNHSAVLINWLLNKTISASTLTSLGVIVNGVGTTASSLTIPGLVDPFNDTEVQCVAFGFGVGNFSPSPVILRVQGVPSEVGSLTCEQTDEDCIECNWEAPFSLTEIHNYSVNITNSRNTTMITSSNTTASVCLGKYWHYEVSVAANNSAGLGAVSSDIVELRPIIWENIHIVSDPTKEGSWNITFTAFTSSFLPGFYDIIAHFNDTTNATGKAEVDHEGKVNGNIMTGRLDERIWDMWISIEYGINVSKPVEINTFGVRQPNVTVNGSRICAEAKFLDGSNIEECLVEYKCSDSYNHGSINITKDNPRDCTKDVRPNNYIVTLYAGRFNDPNKIFAILNAEVTSNTISITLIAETSTGILPSLSFVLPSSTIPVNTDETPISTKLHVYVVIAVVVVSIISIIVIVIIVLISKKKKNKVERKETPEYATQVRSPVSDIKTKLVYLKTEISADRPRVPPTMDEKVQYAQVQNQEDASYSLAIPIPENCFVATQNIPENPNNSEYSHLYRRGYKGPDRPEPACNDKKEMYSTIPLAHGNVNKEFSCAVLSKYVAPYIGHKWEELGLALALTPDDIEQLKENHQGISDVFLLWEQQQTRPFTWETLIMALKSINEHELANRL